MKLWWCKKRKLEMSPAFTKDFYENQRKEMARAIVESPTKEEADKIIEQFKLSHPGEWIENDDAHNFQADGQYQGRCLTRDDDGKYFLSSIDNGFYIARQIMKAIYTQEYGFIPCMTKERTDLDVLSYRGLMVEYINKIKVEQNENSYLDKN